MRTYEVELKLRITQSWVDDGLTATTLQRRIEEELIEMLCPYAVGQEITIPEISVIEKGNPVCEECEQEYIADEERDDHEGLCKQCYESALSA